MIFYLNIKQKPSSHQFLAYYQLDPREQYISMHLIYSGDAVEDDIPFYQRVNEFKPK